MIFAEYNCPSCGAPVKIRRGQKQISCSNCGSDITIPNFISSGYSLDSPQQTTISAGKFSKNFRNDFSFLTIIKIMVIIPLILAAYLLIYQPDFFSEAAKQLSSLSEITSSEEQFATVVLEFGGTGMTSGYFQDPTAICVSPEGNIYVGEEETGKIQVFDANGNFSARWTFAKNGDNYLDAMDLSKDGFLYLAWGDGIYLYQADTGELVDSIANPDNSSFDDIVVTDNGSVFATWFYIDDNIIKFAPNGNIEFWLKEPLSSLTGEIEINTEIEGDGNGNIFAYGWNDETIFKFAPDWRFLNRFGSEGYLLDQFFLLSCFCIDPQGRIWLDDSSGDLIVFDNNGSYIDRFKLELHLTDMLFSENSQLFGITDDDTIVQVDLSELVANL